MRRTSAIRKGGDQVAASNGGATAALRLPAAARRAQLLEVARQAFARHGFRGASMDAIAQAAGVTKPVLYQHFGSKRALYVGLLRAETARLLAVLDEAMRRPGGNEERLRAGFAAYLGDVERSEATFRLLFTEARGVEPAFRRHVERFRREVAARIAAIIAVEAGVSEERARALAVAIVGMAEAAAAWWLEERLPMPARELAEELAGLAWQGFARLPRAGR